MNKKTLLVALSVGLFTVALLVYGQVVTPTVFPAVKLLNVTTGRFLMSDSNGVTTNSAAATGTGSTPVLSENPYITNILALAGNVVVPMPSGFSWPQTNFTVWRNTNGVYSTSVSAKLFDVPRLKTLFVDALRGNDTNTGLTPWLPRRTLNGLLAIGAPYTNINIELTPGVYTVTNASTLTINKEITLKSRGGPSTITFDGKGGASFLFSSSDGGTNTYVAASHSPLGVYDFKNRILYGAPYQLTNVADLATCKVTLGSWVVDSGNCYVTLPDNRQPDNDLVTVANVSNSFILLRRNSYLENIRFLGGVAGVKPDSLSSTSVVAFLNCDFVHSAQNVLAMTSDNGLTILENCGAYWAEQDGFNYHMNSAYGNAAFIEINCRGAYNGNASGADNGSTLHDGYWGVRINGVYAANGERNVHDIGNGGSWNLGCYTGYPFDDDKVNWASGLPAGSDTTKVFLDGCSITGGATTDAYNYNGTSSIFWRSATMTTNLWTTAGTITAY